MFRYFAGSVCCVLVIAMSAPADAQLLRFGGYGYGGGVSIRVPFVSVDVLPFGGGTRVRAPLTSVNTGLYGFSPYRFGPAYPGFRDPYPYGRVIYDPVPVPVYHPPVTVYQPVPVYPQVEQSYAPNYETTAPMQSIPTASRSLPDRLREAAMRLSRSLSTRRDDSDIWLNYLGPDRIVDVIEQNGSPAMLADLVANYDGVVGNGQLGSIRSASGFSETRSLLKQWVVSEPPPPSVLQPQSDYEPSLDEPSVGEPRLDEPADETSDDAAPVVRPEQPQLLPAPPPDPVPAGNAPTPAEDVKAAEEADADLSEKVPTPI